MFVLHRRTFSTLLCLLTVACATVQEEPAGIAAPDIDVAVLEVPHMEASTLSEMSLTVRVLITNQDEEILTLERMEIVSLGIGPYQVFPAERSFRRQIASLGTEAFEVPAQARAMTLDDRVGGQEGNVQIRVVAFFDSPAGGFRKVVVRNVGTTYSRS